jgi:dipeptidyl-peptidase-4
VNEEEFNLRDCWRWSPDAKSIAFWQFDASGIEDFPSAQQHDGTVSVADEDPVSKAGTQTPRFASA